MLRSTREKLTDWNPILIKKKMGIRVYFNGMIRDLINHPLFSQLNGYKRIKYYTGVVTVEIIQMLEA